MNRGLNACYKARLLRHFAPRGWRNYTAWPFACHCEPPTAVWQSHYFYKAWDSIVTRLSFWNETKWRDRISGDSRMTWLYAVIASEAWQSPRPFLVILERSDRIPSTKAESTSLPIITIIRRLQVRRCRRSVRQRRWRNTRSTRCRTWRRIPPTVRIFKRYAC